jgi:serine protease Do
MRLVTFTLIVMFATAVRVQAQDDADLRQAKALEKTMARIIEQNEFAIASILVSRSELYQEFGQGPDKDRPGKLGIFDPQALKTNKRVLRETAEMQTHWPKLMDFTHPAFVPKAFGSGVVIDGDGYILTNYHVIKDATKIFIRLPGVSGYADIHAADPRSDLAVLKLLNRDALPLKAIALGDADKLKRGHFVLTLSNPYAVGFRDGQPSASYGILSNINRRAPGNLKEEERVKPFQFYGTLLQTDTRINLGCSGGALLNLSGELVGVLTSVAAIQGGEAPGGFAIPVNAPMRRIIEVLKRGEEIDYGFLGVGFDERTNNGKIGVRLTAVGPGSPAQLDGDLKIGDVILDVNGEPVLESDDIFARVGIHLAGSKIKLRVRRGNVERIAEITLAKLYVPGKAIASSTGSRPFFRGLRADYSSLLTQQQRMGTIPKGVLISEVQPGTSADRTKLRVGDVITHVDEVAVTTPSAFYQAVAGARDRAVELTISGDPPTRVLLKK